MKKIWAKNGRAALQCIEMNEESNNDRPLRTMSFVKQAIHKQKILLNGACKYIESRFNVPTLNKVQPLFWKAWRIVTDYWEFMRPEFGVANTVKRRSTMSVYFLHLCDGKVGCLSCGPVSFTPFLLSSKKHLSQHMSWAFSSRHIKKRFLRHNGTLFILCIVHC